jgi:FixJ family two-component response regulator
VFITARGDAPMAVAAARKGALGSVEKPFDNEALIRRVRGALISDALARDAARRLALLSARETEVLERLVQGKLNKAIAEELGIAVKTLEFHRKRIVHKLRVKTVADLIRFIAQHRLPGRRAPRSRG